MAVAKLRVVDTTTLDREHPIFVAYGELESGSFAPGDSVTIPGPKSGRSVVSIVDTTHVLVSREPYREYPGIILEAESYDERDAWEAAVQPGSVLVVSARGAA